MVWKRLLCPHLRGCRFIEILLSNQWLTSFDFGGSPCAQDYPAKVNRITGIIAHFNTLKIPSSITNATTSISQPL